MKKIYKEYLIGLDKLMKKTGLTICVPVEAAQYYMGDTNVSGPYIAYDTKKQKHVALFKKPNG